MQTETTHSTRESWLVGKRYLLEDVIGRGGMSEVYRGFDSYFERDVAVKVLRAELARDPTFRMWFRQEAQSAAALSHPSLVCVYDTGEDFVGGVSVPYIVMEYVEGRSLRDVLDSEGAPEFERALRITGGILGALDYSHDSGIVHRDIKPGNVMITRSGEPKVMDFGIARGSADPAAPGDGAPTGGIVGTARYLSPEQARGERVGVPGDIYSTACLLYELLTGHPPFTGASSQAIVQQHIHDDPVPPSTIDPRLPAEVDAVVLRGLAKNPDDRYAGAREMRASVERLSGTGLLEKPPDRGSPRLLPLILAGALVLLVTVLSGWSLASALRSAEVPGVVGADRGAAEEEIRRQNLTPRVVLRYTEEQPRGHVFRQEPAAGTSIERGDAVQLFVSRGPRMVPMPDVVGESKSAAAAKLRSVGLTLGDVDTTPSVEPAGRVLSTDPPARSTADREVPVDLAVSTGPVKVPAVAGESRGGATAILRRGDLAVGDVIRRPSTEPAGRVLATDPPRGSAVKPGTAVDLIVSTGPVRVPDVTGKKAGEAASVLRDSGLEVTRRTRTTTAAPRGTVVAQNPSPRAAAAPGATVTLTVAEPPKPSPSPAGSGSPAPSPSGRDTAPSEGNAPGDRNDRKEEPEQPPRGDDESPAASPARSEPATEDDANTEGD